MPIDGVDHTPAGSAWTVETLRIHTEALRRAQDKFEAERDRRYRELQIEREKAGRIKQRSDQTALALAAEIQKYKDEKANELRAQIGSERGLYPTKAEMFSAIDKVVETIKPLVVYYNSQQGPPRALTAGTIVTAIAVLGSLTAILFAFRHG